MKTSEELIAHCRQKYPALFAAERINIKVSSLEDILRYAFERGESAGYLRGTRNAKTVPVPGDFERFFSGLR